MLGSTGGPLCSKQAPRGAAEGSESPRQGAAALWHLLTPPWELQWRVLMMAPASSIIFRMVPPWTFPATLASSGRMILPGERHGSLHLAAVPRARVAARPATGSPTYRTSCRAISPR